MNIKESPEEAIERKREELKEHFRIVRTQGVEALKKHLEKETEEKRKPLI